MTEQMKKRMIELHEWKVKLTEFLLARAKVRLEYWSDNRFIGASTRLNQSKEFISNQIAEAKLDVEICSNQLNRLVGE